MRATHRDALLPRASNDRGHPDVVWGVRGLMAEAILPDRPVERRKRRRLRALRAMNRLGLLGEENLIPTLARRPELRWLADEEGARWDVLAELGRIGRRDAFDEAVEWTVKARPRPDEARAHFFGAGTGARRHDGGVGSDARGTVASRTAPGLPQLRGPTRREEGRR
jgi:hypothetical protein